MTFTVWGFLNPHPPERPVEGRFVYSQLSLLKFLALLLAYSVVRPYSWSGRFAKPLLIGQLADSVFDSPR